jgi:hypothetical protein
MSKKYVVQLSSEERDTLQQVAKKRKSAAWKVQRAQAMLLCDAGPDGPGWPDTRVAEKCRCTTRSMESWRKRAVEEGPLSLLERKPPDSPRFPRKLDGAGEAHLLQLACSPTPVGEGRWTLRLLADRLVELKIVDAISHETVRRTLKKTRSSRGVDV